MGKLTKLGTGTAKIFRKQGNILGISITGTHKNILLTAIGKYLLKNSQFEGKLRFSGSEHSRSVGTFHSWNEKKEKQSGSNKISWNNKPLFITTPNPEHVLLAQKDQEFKKILRFSDISLCDGVGLLAGHEFFLRKTHESNSSNLSNWPNFIRALFFVLKKGASTDGVKVIKGREFFLDLMELANRKKYRVFLLGATKNVLEKTVLELRKKFPSVQYGYEWNIEIDNNGVPAGKRQAIRDKLAVQKINSFTPDMLFVAFGAPKQEKWVYRNLEKLKTGVVMVVGGTFDYVSGGVKLPPKIFEVLKLEWLWRLFTEPRRIKRIYSAVIKFPMMVIKGE